jgi:hypothetical protein
MPLGAKRPRKCQKAPTFRPQRLLKPNVAATFRPRRLLKPNVAATFRTRRLLKPNVATTYRTPRLLWPNVATTLRCRRLPRLNAAATFRMRRLLWPNAATTFRCRILAPRPLPFALCAVRPVSSSPGLPISKSGKSSSLAATAQRRRVPGAKKSVSSFMARARLVGGPPQEYAENTKPAVFWEEGFFGPRSPPKQQPMPRASSRDLASPAPCSASRVFAPSTKARDACASKVALLLRKRSPRSSPLPKAPKFVHALTRPTLSSSRGARGRRCFAASSELDHHATLSWTTAPGLE